MDQIDEKILEELNENSALSKRKIAKRSGLPLTTVFHRIKKMEKEGIIRKYTIEIDHEKLGFGICAYILVSIQQNSPDGKKYSQKEIATYIKKMFANVESVSIVTGDIDMIIKARFKSIKELNSFLTSKLRNVDGVAKTVTSVVLEEV
ncbi:MAG: Lrp/AsnC family transcriptional regulator [Candidatus Diapherotrites archaeon]|nr:Lrp/AsnC family transcriptional regulator [Candidatus Diapherotrites archaeon]